MQTKNTRRDPQRFRIFSKEFSVKWVQIFPYHDSRCPTATALRSGQGEKGQLPLQFRAPSWSPAKALQPETEPSPRPLRKPKAAERGGAGPTVRCGRRVSVKAAAEAATAAQPCQIQFLLNLPENNLLKYIMETVINNRSILEGKNSKT